MRLKINLSLTIIIIIAVFFRFNQLSNVPPSASLDEASIGYNAYSILKTGADEYGTKFPILLRAYDDWRPGLHVYLVIPFIKLLGLNIVSVRLSSIILSITTIIGTYFLTQELFKNKNLALLSAFLLAISPWHIYISRLGHEVNAGLALAIFAILFFLKTVNSKKRLFIILSSILFGLALYTYQSEKVFVPLILLILVFIYRNNLFKIKEKLLAPLFLGIIIITPIALVTFSPQGLVRFKATSAFSEESFYRKSAENVLKYKKEGNLLGEIINNRRLVPLKIFTTNYFSHFNPKFLFGNSGNESFKAPNFGLMYVWELPFLLIGLVNLLRLKNEKTKLLILWLIIAFIAPSITTGAPHAMRAFNVLPVPQIFVGLGIAGMINFLRKSNFKPMLNIYYIFMLAVVIYFLSSFYREYFYFFPKNQSASFQYSLSNAVKFVSNKEKAYDKVVFSNEENLYQSYMFYLFYAKYDPKVYQKQGGTKSGGFDKAHEFGKYEFRLIVWSKDKLLKKTLLIGNESDFPENINYQKSFTNLDGKGIIKVVDLK